MPNNSTLNDLIQYCKVWCQCPWDAPVVLETCGVHCDASVEFLQMLAPLPRIGTVQVSLSLAKLFFPSNRGPEGVHYNGSWLSFVKNSMDCVFLISNHAFMIWYNNSLFQIMRSWFWYHKSWFQIMRSWFDIINPDFKSWVHDLT